MKRIRILTLIFTSLLTVACAEDPVNCTVVQNTDGSSTILCDDGSKSTIRGCSVTEDATEYTVACPDGTEINIPKGTIDPQEHVLEGSFTVENMTDLNLIKGYTEITGDLTFKCEGITEINMENLVHIGGAVEIGGMSSLTSVSLNSLVSVDGIRIFSNPNLEELNMDLLESVNTVYITDNPQLAQCSLDELFDTVDIAGNVTMSSNDNTATCP